MKNGKNRTRWIAEGSQSVTDICLSQKIFDRIKQFFPQIKPGLASAQVLLANTYASNGDFSRASNIRIQIEKLGLKKKMGISKTVVNGQIQVSFTMKNRLNSNENFLFNLGIPSSR
jgi:TRAP-type mannitol/chloroaromatic compound transport system permease large subunit